MVVAFQILQHAADSKGMHHKIFNDAVHGHISLDPLLVAIIDTVEFQRLRSIKQLGMGYYVYPSACHNRFEHSLGTCHMARKFLDAIEKTDLEETSRLTPQERLCVLIAALCHDVGHGPFSHTWEKFLKKAREQDPSIPAWNHENASAEVLDRILKTPKVSAMMTKRAFTSDHIRLIKELIDVPDNVKETDKYYMYQIVSNKDNDIDVDKWDYILRDALLLNVKTNFDAERLINFSQVLLVRRDGELMDRTEICFRDKEVKGVVDMLQARAVLHDKAYQHPVVQILETMLLDALLLANKARPDWGLTNTNVEHLLTLTDKIYQDILYSNDINLQAAKDILIRIETRNLYEILYRYDATTSIDNYPDLTKAADAFYMHHGMGKCSRQDIEVVQIKVDMGSKYNGNVINCYQFKKNSKIPEKLSRNNHLFASNASQVLRRELIALYKGTDEAVSEKIRKQIPPVSE